MKGKTLLVSWFMLASITLAVGQEIWSPFGLQGKYLGRITITETGMFHASTPEGLFRSTDGGGNWINLSSSWRATEITSAIVSPASNTLLASATGPNGWVFCRSTDNGGSWQELTSQFGSYIRGIAATKDGTLFAASDHAGIYRSTDDGISWHVVNNYGGTTTPVAVAPTGDIYVGTHDPSVFRSTDNGATWSTVLYIPGVYGVYSIAIDQATGHIFVGTETAGTGIWRSADNGQTWQHINNSDSPNRVYEFAIRGSGEIFAASADGGVYHSVNDGINWTQMNSGLPSLQVTSLAFDRSGYLYAASNVGLFTTGPGLVPAPVQIIPADQGGYQPTSLTFNWLSVPGVLLYRLQISEEPTFGTLVYDDASIFQNSRYVASLRPGTTYYWRVGSKRTDGTFSFSGRWQFTTVPQTLSAEEEFVLNTIMPGLKVIESIRTTTFAIAVDQQAMINGAYSNCTKKGDFVVYSKAACDVDPTPYGAAGGSAFTGDRLPDGLQIMFAWKSDGTVYMGAMGSDNDVLAALSDGQMMMIDNNFVGNVFDGFALMLELEQLTGLGYVTGYTSRDQIYDYNYYAKTAVHVYNRFDKPIFRIGFKTYLKQRTGTTDYALIRLWGAYNGFGTGEVTRTFKLNLVNKQSSFVSAAAANDNANASSVKLDNVVVAQKNFWTDDYYRRPSIAPTLVELWGRNGWSETSPHFSMAVVCDDISIADVTQNPALPDGYSNNRMPLVSCIPPLQTTGVIAGHVILNGNGLPQVTAILEDETGHPVPSYEPIITGSDGSFTWPEVAPGNYLVNIIQPLGYVADQNPKPATIAGGSIATVDFVLTPLFKSLSSTTIAADFNGTAIPAGSTIWLNSIIKPSGLGAEPVNLYLLNSTVTYTLNGVTTTLPVPQSHIRFDPTATEAGTNVTNGVWETMVPSSFDKNVFLTGLAVPIAAGLPGGIKQATWNCQIGTDQPSAAIQWKWAAAVYTTFGDYVSLKVKPIDGSQFSPYANSDLAGTPEAMKQFVTGGARGGGGANYTGGYSGTKPVSFTAPLQKFVVDELAEIPNETRLLQNYPNPFNPSTTIWYGLPTNATVKLTVYNTLGEEVTVLVNGAQIAGYHQVQFDAGGLATGVYFYRLQAGSYVETRKLLLTK